MTDEEKINMRSIKNTIKIMNRNHELERHVTALISDNQYLRKEVSELKERQRGEMEIRRVAAMYKIPRKVVVDKFSEWMATQDFNKVWKEYDK